MTQIEVGREAIPFRHAVSSTEPDWTREDITRFWEPGRKLLRSIRRYQTLRRKRGMLASVARKYWVVNHRFWSVITQCEIQLNCEIGGGLLLPHPTGIIVNSASRIGPNCLIFHQVTLIGHVVLGGHVDVGAGAKVIGPVLGSDPARIVGDHVRIGANAVVTKDVPDFADAYGVPARIVVRSDD